LIGHPIRGQVLAALPGHAANIEFARKVRKKYEGKPSARRFATGGSSTVFDANAVLKMLPHRYPFLMVDRIVEFSPEASRIVGVKNITFNEPQFMGHFPGRPIFPGVLIMEAMAQTGCLLLISRGIDPEKKLVVFTGMNNVKFRREVVPGDQLVMELEMTRFRFNICQLIGKAYVDGQLVAEAELQAAVVDREVVQS
jgi:UDP-3-O-[3-hydroxymyristoyl] N-acetylglucosamine deacetylase/3-hydroxyacyl-[acyl-carrier-protein] dehydratase